MSDQPLYNSRVIKTFLEYLNTNYPDLDTKIILDNSGMTIYEVNDGGHWFNQNQVDKFTEIVMKMTKNPHIALEVGRFSPSSKAAGSMTNFLTGFITPGAAYKFMGKMYSQISRSCYLETKSLGSNQVEISVKQKIGVL